MKPEQQYRVIGKSGPGVEPRAGMVIAFIRRDGTRDDAYTLDAKIAAWCKRDDISGPDWNAGKYEILEAISSPQAAVATCESWCGRPCRQCPGSAKLWFDACTTGACGGLCPCPGFCTQECLDRAKAAKGKQGPAKHALCEAVKGLWLCDLQPGHEGMHHCTVADAGGGNWMFWRDDAAPTCIRSACKAPPVAGGELCVAHAGQVEAAKTGTASAARCGHAGPLSCGKCADCTAAPVPAPAETRLERWRREHKGYSHGTADPRLHDANVAAMMVGIDGPREPYVPPAPLPPWTPRDLDGDIPDAWEPGGARLGGTR